MSTPEASFNRLPAPILDKLQTMIRRVRRLLFVRGFFATLAVGLACLLAIMAIDATVTIFSQTARWILSLTGLAIILAAGWWFLVRPLSRKLTLTHIARILEVRHPELQERISTAVELMSSDDPDSIRGSEELIEAVVDSAVIDVEKVDPRSEFRAAKASRFIAIAGVVTGVLLLLLAIWPQKSWTLLTRAVAPFLDLGNAYADTLVIDPGNARIAKGSAFTVNMSVDHKRLRRAELRKVLPDGSESVERMTLMGEGQEGEKRFSLTFPSVEEGFRYRIRAGSAVSRYFEVVAVPAPEVEELVIRYEYPEYTGLEPKESVSGTGEIRALTHSRVTVTAKLNKPIFSAKLLLNGAREIGSSDTSTETNAVWQFPLFSGMNGVWQLRLEDGDGFENEESVYPIQVLPDKNPEIRITSPAARELRLRPTEVLPITYEVTEDFNVGSLDLLIKASNGTSLQEIPQPLPGRSGEPNLFRGESSLALASLDLPEGQNRITAQLRVRDNRPEELEGPGEGFSEVITILLDKNAPTLAEQTIQSQKQELLESIKEVRQELERAKDDLNRTEQEMKQNDDFSDKARQELNDFTERATKAQETLEDTAASLDKSVFDKQAETLSEIAKSEVARAREKAHLIPLTDKKEERIENAREARKEVEQAISDLRDAERSVQESEDDYRMLTELSDLANRQQELAQNANDQARRDADREQQLAQENNEAKKNEMQRQQMQELRQFQNQQRQVQQKLGQMLKDNAAALEQILEKQQDEAQQLSAQAAALAQQQEDLKKVSEQSSSAKQDQLETLKNSLLEQLKERQKKIAAETEAARNAVETPKGEDQPQSSPDNRSQPEQANQESPSESLASAAEETRQASENLNSENLEKASEQARNAAESLAKAARETKPEEGGDQTPGESASSEKGKTSQKPNQPARGKPSSEDLARLSEQQKAVAEQIGEVQAGNLQEALAQLEGDLAEDSRLLQEETASFEQTLQNLNQNQSKGFVNQARSRLQQGENEAKQAGRSMEQAQAQQNRAMQQNRVESGQLAKDAKSSMQQGQGKQDQARARFEQAARALQDSAKTIGQTKDGMQPSEDDERLGSGEDLAESFQDVTDSAQSQDSQEAADNSQQAAQSLQDLARAAMQQMGGINPENNTPNNQQQVADQPSQVPNDGEFPEKLNETGLKNADIDGSGVPPELSELGVTLEDWTRFKGALTSGSATAIESDLPQEYRELVGRYFQVIAKEAGKSQ